MLSDIRLYFPDSSVGKESTCNAGDPGSIPLLGRSAAERIGYPLQYSWTSLVVQLLKNVLAMRETWILCLRWGFSGEGIGYPLQYFWASLVVQLVKNPPAMWETWVRSRDWEDPLENG